MKYKANMEAVSALPPDYLGFIFYDKSSRHFDGEIQALPESIKKTGVFVDETLQTVLDIVSKYQLDAVQLHGHESPDYCRQIKSNTNIEIIKVFSIKDEFDFSVLQPYEDIVDYFLFDTKGQLPGGNGYTFNWSVLEQYPSTTPYFLSGGIGLNEIENIKAFQEHPASKYCYAIDVNSKFEIEPGLKDIEQLKEFKQNLSFYT